MKNSRTWTSWFSFITNGVTNALNLLDPSHARVTKSFLISFPSFMLFIFISLCFTMQYKYRDQENNFNKYLLANYFHICAHITNWFLKVSKHANRDTPKHNEMISFWYTASYRSVGVGLCYLDLSHIMNVLLLNGWSV